MLSAYHDCSCDSHGLFDDKEIARTQDYARHLNQYNVICLDITGFISDMKRKKKPLDLVPDIIVETIQDELKSMDPELADEKNLNDCIIRYVERHGGRQFIFIIDEWDAMIREAKEDESAQQAYLNLLRGWFKNTNFTPRAAAAESFMDYINQDYNGLSKTIAELIGGVDVKINTTGFANDLKTFRGKDDVLTLLVHFGYLAYDSEMKTVQIPNEEIKLEFQRSIREVKHEATLKRPTQSDQLFPDTIQKKEDAVAARI